MRENLTEQRPLVSSVIQHSHAAELDRMSELLNKLPGAARRVAADLQRGVVNPGLGRRGLSGEQVLRIVVLKQLTGFSYEQLAFHLEDSLTYRRFCLLGIDGWSPKASTFQRRIFDGETVPAEDKVVSMFEPHTDILLKGGRDTVYGHKVFLTTGRSGLVLDLTVEQGNPADASRTVPLIRRHKRLFGAVPQKATFDAGFASAANQTELMSLGVRKRHTCSPPTVMFRTCPSPPQRLPTRRPLATCRADSPVQLLS